MINDLVHKCQVFLFLCGMMTDEKICSRCKKHFNCNVNDIANCQCNTVKLTETESDYIASLYHDCLCVSCITILQIVANETELSYA